VKIETQTEFERWLDANFWLENAIIYVLEPYPKHGSGYEPPSEIRLNFTLQVEGSYEAGKTRWIRDIEITAQGLKDYFIEWDERFVPGHCCQGLEIINVEQGVGFTLDTPGAVQVVCASLEVLQSPDREEIVKPWFNDREFIVRATLQKLPTPEDWVNHFHRQGWEMVWRYHHGDEQALEKVPTDYTGWFLQLRSRLNENSQGLFFYHCRLEGERVSLHLVKYDEALQKLWIEAGKYIATFPEVSITCGNVTMSQVEWLAHLAQCDT
jgi:hypothetical protein